LRQPVADSRRLCWLNVRVAHADRVRPALNGPRQRLQQVRQFLNHQVQRRAKPQRIGIVLNVCARRAQVQDAAAQRTLLGERAQLGHQVVVHLCFNRPRSLQVNRVSVRRQVCRRL